MVLLAVFVPHRWLLFVLYPVRPYTYHKLLRLDEEIRHLAELQTVTNRSRRLIRPGDLELAIYRVTISILDHYALIREDELGEAMYQQIEPLVHTMSNYSELVKGLAAIRV